MENLEILRNQIFEFLGSDSPEVMAIKGDWGVGKTHAWEYFLKEATEENKINEKFKSYSYASLFGIESIDKLRDSIFEKTIIKKSIRRNRFLLTITNLFKKSNISIFENIASIFGFGQYGKILDSGIKHAISQFFSPTDKNTIICLDDFERTEVNAHVVLGLVSELKERKNCKVILIFNEEKLEEGHEPTKKQSEQLPNNTDSAKTPYEKYSEKVIDMQIKFNPTPAECAEICFGKDSGILDADILKEAFVKLGLTNIRIMNKIIMLWGKLESYFDGMSPAIKSRFIFPLVLIKFAYEERNKNISLFNYIKDNKLFAPYVFSKDISEEGKKFKEENSALVMEWSQKLSKFNVYHGDSITNMILKYVENGYIVEDEIVKERNNYDETTKKDLARWSYHNSWAIFHNSFQDNKQELIESIYETGEEYIIGYILPFDESLRALNILIYLFRKIGEDEKANEFIEKYIQEAKLKSFGYHDIELKEAVKRHPHNRGWDNILTEKINELNEKNEKNEIEMTLDNILRSITQEKEFSFEEEEIIKSASRKDFYDFFTTANIRNMRQCAERCLYIPNCFKALDKIRRDGTLLNEYRVENLTGWEKAKEHFKNEAKKNKAKKTKPKT